MMLYIYKAFCDNSDKKVWKKNYQSLQDAQRKHPLVRIMAHNISEADHKYEELTGINPERYCGHTPPITVSIHKA